MNYTEPLEGIEPLTSSLPRKCSTTELQRLFESLKSVGQKSPKSHSWLIDLFDLFLTRQERKTRLELATYSLEGYRSTKWATSAYKKNCGQGWIRTTELRRGQIYSLLPLATWLLAHNFKHTKLSHLSESNQRPTDYKSVALPAELKWLFIFVVFKELVVDWDCKGRQGF